jgi:polyhydroxyalkanoate synthesis regulator phasin
MVREALTNYLSLASGLSEVTRKRARAAAKALVAQGEATVEQVTALAEEVLESSRSNRTALVNLVRYEVDRALGRVGLATTEDQAALQRRIAELEKSIRELRESIDRDEDGDEHGRGPAPTTVPPGGLAPKPAKAAKAAKPAKAGPAKAGKATKVAKQAKAGKAAKAAPAGKKAAEPASTLAPPPKKTAAKAAAPSAGGSAGPS